MDNNPLLSALPELEATLDYVFKDKSLLLLAFIHSTYYNEHRSTVQDDNERLEFVGDSVLNLLIAEYLYCTLPAAPEGELSQLRSCLVDADSCFELVQKLGVDRFLLLGRGERLLKARGRHSIVSNLFEALLGAIYLDAGWEAVKGFFFSHFTTWLESRLNEPKGNWKAQWQALIQKQYQKTPQYRVVKESGPDHEKYFLVETVVDLEVKGSGDGSSKKSAEQAAAKDALSRCSNLSL